MNRLKKFSICFGVFALFFIFISKNQVSRVVPCNALDVEEPGLISEILNDVEIVSD